MGFVEPPLVRAITHSLSSIPRSITPLYKNIMRTWLGLLWGSSNPQFTYRSLTLSVQAHRQILRDETTTKYRREFRKSDRHLRLTRIDPSMPSSKYRKLITELPRRFVSVLTQLRTNHVPLQAYLHRFKLADSPICPHCEEAPETVTHFIMFCSNFAGQRRQLRRSLGPHVNLNLSVLRNSKHLPDLFRFINSTDRFGQNYGNLDPASNS